ncbi:MAG: GGDEF domain-containing protein [Desulfovibrionaceae bacterium]|nr:GGDEF domain-containing protein [Desulfovibrionaceae bacterium]
MTSLSIRTKLILALSAILVPSILGISFLNYQVSRDAVRDELRTSSLPLTGETVYSEVHGDLMRPIFVSSLMANDTFLKDWALAGEEQLPLIVKYLREIKAKYGFFAAFYVSARTGKYYYYDGVLKTLSREDAHDVWFYRFVESGLEYDLDVDTNEASNNQLTIFINFRVNDYSGKLLGVTGVGLNMDRVAQLVANYKQKYDREIFMTAVNGTMQVHSNQALIEQVNLQDLPGIGPLSNDILYSNKAAANYEYDAGDGHHLLAVRFIPEFDWFLFVDQNDRAFLWAARANFVRTVTIGLAASLVVIFICVLAVNHFQTRLERLARTDELTGAANRRAFEEQFAGAQYRNQRYGTPFTALLLDLDGFKAVNDRLGHQAGDRLLVRVANLLASTIRPTDHLARWGGDEFIVLLEGDMQEARAVAERIRRAVAEQAAIPNKPETAGKAGAEGKAAADVPAVPAVTVSCGMAEYVPGEDLDGLTLRADMALYAAKNRGRDVIFCHGDPVA